MLTEGLLVTWLKRDWENTHRIRDSENVSKVYAAPLMVMAGSGMGDNQKTPNSEGSRSGKRKRRDNKGDNRDDRRSRDDKEPKATIDGRRLTLSQYLCRRRFYFLHLYSGRGDPLGKAIWKLGKANDMKVSVVACERDEGTDLLQDYPYLELLDKAKDGHWDGVHSGFPCTTFTRL